MNGTLAGFYELMESTVDVRRRMVVEYIEKGDVEAGDLNLLRKVLQILEDLPVGEEGKNRLLLEGSRTLDVDLGYEKEELKKDLFFFEKGEKEFSLYLASMHSGFDEYVKRGFEFLHGKRFRNFVTDRDGTVNNYCGRYRSSVQSAYNAVYLTRFIRSCTDNAVIVTSAPLQNPGIATISVMDKGTFIYAASKAREFIDASGVRRTYPIDPDANTLLDQLNKRLAALVKKPGREKFALIGSGLQFKFGETTIARQDITGAVTEEESTAFKKEVEQEVEAVDPSLQKFYIVDTGLDIEIILKKGGTGSVSEEKFDKGDGLLFLDRELGLNLKKGPNLVCGDTSSDLKLVDACVQQSDETWTVFVTRDEKLAAKVNSTGAENFIVPEPDMLVFMLDRLSESL